MLEKQLREVEQFHRAITGLVIPEQPTLLTGERMSKSMVMLNEEISEFHSAETIGDQADALIDLIYFAYGRLLEMGIRPGPAFQLVHAANMAKVRGPNKRGDQFEAMKPEGWTPPDWETFINGWKVRDGLEQRGQYAGLTRSNNPWDGTSTPKPKILLLGYGRHGKDTVAEMLRDRYGLKFTSSSFFCAEKVMLPFFQTRSRDWFDNGAKRGEPKPVYYDNASQCFEDRHNHRATWFQQIEQFNTPNKAALGEAIFADYDIYCGLRSKREFAAVKNAGLYDVCIWVDRSDHVPPEGKESCTVEPWMADFVLDNNGTLEELAFNLDQLMECVL